MIQRIQTLFLLATLGLVIAILSSKAFYTAEYTVKYTEYTPYLVLSIATLIITFFTIFMYHHRMFQIRLCIFNTIVFIAFQCWIAYAFFTCEPGTVFSITAVFPAVCAILTFMALRYIARDEAMVRASNSLRNIEKRSRKK